MKHLYFIRHGLSVMNKQGVFSSTTNTPLAPEGVEQCRLAAQQLKGAGVDFIVSSPFERAQQSATIIAEELGIDPSTIILNDNFVERSFGPLEGTPYKPNMEMDHIEGVEHSDELITRVQQGLEEVRALKANCVLIVSHGAVGRALNHLLHPDIPYKGGPKFNNAQVVKLL
jgi:broad specificity phosphatase PhoE